MVEQDKPSSRLPGFYELSLRERTSVVARLSHLSDREKASIEQFGQLSGDLADTFIENAVGTYSLPLGVATNFCINGKEILIPMAVEESSVLAAASFGAKLTRAKGGFRTSSTEPIMTGQVQVILHKHCDYDFILNQKKSELIEYANRGHSRLVDRGGGAKDLTWYFIPEIKSLVLNLHVHTGEAMGANIVNTMCEKISVFMEDLLPGGELGLRILTNLTDRRMAKAECTIPAHTFETKTHDGAYVVKRIVQAWEFAWFDIYRATTHNKGVMNGIDPVLIATGNDWRAAEAAAHAHAARSGAYRPLTLWKMTEEGDLFGQLELPMALGTVGGVTKLHPTAQAALKLLGLPCAQKLAEIVCAVGLAQNLSALRALSIEGIQRGHMSLHKKNLDLLSRREQRFN